jgi:hypothetical protein
MTFAPALEFLYVGASGVLFVTLLVGIAVARRH